MKMGLKSVILLVTTFFAVLPTFAAPRQMEKLSRGLAVSKMSSGTLVSWRLLGTESPDTEFNLYRDGTKIATIGKTAGTNYLDKDGSVTAKYTVAPVVNGKEGGKSATSIVFDEFAEGVPYKTIKGLNVPEDQTMPDGSTKKVGNTIKSRKMSGYLEKFIDTGINLLLNGKGYDFLSNYYDYIEKIYNYQIPIKDIASKGNIKKSIKEYKEDCKTLTKAGSKKSRQAWYELVIKEGINANVSDTIYYINTGTKKGHSDVKRVTHYYYFNNGEKTEITKEVEKLYKANSKAAAEAGVDSKKTRLEIAKENYGNTAFDEDEIILNCKLVPNEILDKEEDVLCSDYEGLEYNVEKYIDQFNKRITPLLVCFHPDIRGKILITNPKNRMFFTEAESALVSGYPNKDGDQDTYEALMTPERKEIEFWTKIGEVPPFIKECGIDWDKLVEEYKKQKAEEDTLIFRTENDKYLEALNNLTKADVEEFEEEGKLPTSITSIMTLKEESELKKYISQDLEPNKEKTGENEEYVKYKFKNNKDTVIITDRY